MGQIGKLFIAGFGSSMVFGTVVGALADKQCVAAWVLLGACRSCCCDPELVFSGLPACGRIALASHMLHGCIAAAERPQPPPNCRAGSPPRRPPPVPVRSGRKRAALTYCVTYTLGCLTKHFNNFWVLCGGRVLCGIATSLLFSAFESWLVSEHFKVISAPLFCCVGIACPLLALAPRLLGGVDTSAAGGWGGAPPPVLEDCV